MFILKPVTMLAYNFPRIFKARGIDKPFAYLVSVGFSDSFASKVKRNNVKRLNPRELEKLCIILKCTPNDLLEWTEDDQFEVESSHPIRKLKKPEKMQDLTKTIHSIPLDKVEEINEMINEKIRLYDRKK
jgi:DNA-binding Xre family transcriptional regulator